MIDVPEVKCRRHIHSLKSKCHNCCADHQRHGPNRYDNRKAIQDKDSCNTQLRIQGNVKLCSRETITNRRRRISGVQLRLGAKLSNPSCLYVGGFEWNPTCGGKRIAAFAPSREVCRLRDCSATPRPCGTAVARAPASNLARRPSCRTHLFYVGGSTERRIGSWSLLIIFFAKRCRLRDSNWHHNKLFRKRLFSETRRVTPKSYPARAPDIIRRRW